MKRSQRSLLTLLLVIGPMAQGPVGAAPPTYEIAMVHPSSEFSSAMLFTLSGYYHYRTAPSVDGYPPQDCLSELPLYRQMVDGSLPGLDSKLIPTSELSPGVTPADRVYRLEDLGGSLGTATAHFKVKYVRHDCTIAGFDGPDSPLAFTIPSEIRWIIVIPVSPTNAPALTGSVRFSLQRI